MADSPVVQHRGHHVGGTLPALGSLPALTYRPRAETTEVILHASHTTPNQSYLKEFLEVKGRRMGLLTIGYHYVIMRDGFILCTRPHTAHGSHCPGYNHKSIGVCLAGGLKEPCGPGNCEQCDLRNETRLCDEQPPEDNFTPQQGDALRSLMQELEAHYGHPLALRGHSELKRYANRERRCPPTDMEKVRQWVKQ